MGTKMAASEAGAGAGAVAAAAGCTAETARIIMTTARKSFIFIASISFCLAVSRKMMKM